MTVISRSLHWASEPCTIEQSRGEMKRERALQEMREIERDRMTKIEIEREGETEKEEERLT